MDLVPSDYRQGQDVFVGEQLGCDLGTGCYGSFDERVQGSVAVRATPAHDMLGVGEEWRVTVSGEMEADSTQASAAATAELTGSVGFSQCVQGNGSDPCPFYLGSLSLARALLQIPQLGRDKVADATRRRFPALLRRRKDDASR